MNVTIMIPCKRVLEGIGHCAPLLGTHLFPLRTRALFEDEDDGWGRVMMFSGISFQSRVLVFGSSRKR